MLVVADAMALVSAGTDEAGDGVAVTGVSMAGARDVPATLEATRASWDAADCACDAIDAEAAAADGA